MALWCIVTCMLLKCQSFNCGVPPLQNWSDNERLNLRSVGQMAAPFQSAWIGASIVKQLQMLFSHVVPLEPCDVLNELKQLVLRVKPFSLTSPGLFLVQQQTNRSFMSRCRMDPLWMIVDVCCGHRAVVRDLLLSAEGDLLHVPLYDLALCLADSEATLDWDLCVL